MHTITNNRACVYNKGMNFLRQTAVYLVGVVLIFLLLMIATTVAVTKTASNPEYVKSALKTSGFYDNFVDNTLNFTQDNQFDLPEEVSGQVDIDLEPIIKQTFTPGVIQTVFDKIIDGSYLWLNGKTELPEFNIDLADIKTNLVSSISSFYQDKVNNLPVCNDRYNYSSFDIAEATCVPQGLSIPANMYTEIASNTIGEIPIFDKQQLTFESFDFEGVNDKSSAWRQVSKYYNWFNWSPIVLSVLFVIGMVLVFVVLRSHAHSFKVYGRVFLTAGLLLLIGGAITILFVGQSLDNVSFSGASEASGFSQDAFIPVVKQFSRSTGWWALYFGIGFTLAGIGSYFLSRKMRRQENVDPINKSQYLKQRQNGRN